VKVKLFPGEKMKALKTIIEAGRIFDLKKIVHKRRAMGLADHRNIVTGTFLAIPEEAPAHKQGLGPVPLENDSEDVRATEKELQDKVRGIDLKCFIEQETGQIHRIVHFEGLDFIFLERNGFKRISGCGPMQTKKQNPSKEEIRFAGVQREAGT
jgi:hypothetical protein